MPRLLPDCAALPDFDCYSGPTLSIFLSVGNCGVFFFNQRGKIISHPHDCRSIFTQHFYVKLKPALVLCWDFHVFPQIYESLKVFKLCFAFFTGSLVDFLKTTEGSNLRINTLIDMASQARLFKYIYFSSVLIIHFNFSHQQRRVLHSGLIW